MGNTLALPLRVTSTGAFATLNQDDPTEISQSVALLLATRPGERRSVQDYGLPDPLFSGVNLAVVAAVVAEWEDRADDVVLEQVVTGVTETINLTHTAAAAPTPALPPVVPPVVVPQVGLLVDPDNPGFYRPAGALTEDLAHPGYFLPIGGAAVEQDPDRPGFYSLDTTGAA